MKLHAFYPTHPQWRERPFILELAKQTLDGCASPETPISRGSKAVLGGVRDDDDVPEHFPRFRVFWRLYYTTERRITGRLPMAILTPTVGAFAGTAWAVSHPSETIRHGLVVAEPSFGQVLVSAIAGGVAVVILVTALIFWGTFLYEQIVRPALHRQGAWQPIYWPNESPSSDPDLIGFQLACRMDPPVSPKTLGDMECWIKRPDGEMDTISGNNVVRVMEVSLAGEPPSTPAAHVWYHLRGMYGRYEVRWHGTVRKRYEIARAKFEIEPR